MFCSFPIIYILCSICLQLTGIFSKLGDVDQGLRIFHSGESMVLSLLATVLERNTLSLDQLPSSISNCRKLALSGAMCLKDKFPNEAADAFIRWKSFFSEFRSILIRLGLGECYRDAFKAVETFVSKGEGSDKQQAFKSFRASESQCFRKYSLSVVKAMYDHSYSKVSEALSESDVAIDYIFKIYNPEHHNPPQQQACIVVITPKDPPVVVSISDKVVQDLMQKWPEAIYKLWQSNVEEFDAISKSLSDALFPEPVRKVLLNPLVQRAFISPDTDLMCFPIDQLPIHDEQDGSTLPLYQRVAVSILSSPREILRDATVKQLLKLNFESAKDPEKGKGSHDSEASSTEGSGAAVEQDAMRCGKSQEYMTGNQKREELAQDLSNLQVSDSKLKCFLVANPDYKLECTSESNSSWKTWLGTFGSILGSSSQPISSPIHELKGTEKEAEEVYQLLCSRENYEVCPPITEKKATISAVLDLNSPHILHLATHGYSSKRESAAYHGNFWSDESSGILLAGAQTFREKKFDRIDTRAGTGHMNCIAICGLQLEGTRLVYISSCDSSVGARPSQEMPASVTHAMRASGAETVISTLWKISDTEAVEFATLFYGRLMKKPECRPSEALSYAKAVMHQQGHSMFHWGAYMCHGIDSPITI